MTVSNKKTYCRTHAEAPWRTPRQWEALDFSSFLTCPLWHLEARTFLSFLIFSCVLADLNMKKKKSLKWGGGRERPTSFTSGPTDSFTAKAAHTWPEKGCWWPLESSKRPTQSPHLDTASPPHPIHHLTLHTTLLPPMCTHSCDPHHFIHRPQTPFRPPLTPSNLDTMECQSFMGR